MVEFLIAQIGEIDSKQVRVHMLVLVKILAILDQPFLDRIKGEILGRELPDVLSASGLHHRT